MPAMGGHSAAGLFLTCESFHRLFVIKVIFCLLSTYPLLVGGRHSENNPCCPELGTKLGEGREKRNSVYLLLFKPRTSV